MLRVWSLVSHYYHHQTTPNKKEMTFDLPQPMGRCQVCGLSKTSLPSTSGRHSGWPWSLSGMALAYSETHKAMLTLSNVQEDFRHPQVISSETNQSVKYLFISGISKPTILLCTSSYQELQNQPMCYMPLHNRSYKTNQSVTYLFISNQSVTCLFISVHITDLLNLKGAETKDASQLENVNNNKTNM